MKRTSDNLQIHEFVGLRVKVLRSSDPTLVGCEGTVVYETMKTFHILREERKMIIPKQGSRFQFTMDDRVEVLLDGNRILKRPEDRVMLSV